MPEKKFDIEKISKLAHLKLSKKEKMHLQGHLEKILEYVQQLNTVNTSDEKPTSHILPLQNIFREDLEKQPFGNSERFLTGAPKHDKGHYEVPKIIS